MACPQAVPRSTDPFSSTRNGRRKAIGHGGRDHLRRGRHGDGQHCPSRALANRPVRSNADNAHYVKSTSAYVIRCRCLGVASQRGPQLDTVDFGINPKAPEFGRYGVCYGKAMRGSPPKRRGVLTVWDCRRRSSRNGPLTSGPASPPPAPRRCSRLSGPTASGCRRSTGHWPATAALWVSTRGVPQGSTLSGPVRGDGRRWRRTAGTSLGRRRRRWEGRCRGLR